MEVRQLRYFTKTFETGNITRAAAALSIVQPALSQQLVRLERELGVRLLVRSSKGIVPTEAGRVLYQYARTVLRQLDHVRTAIRSKENPFPLVGAVSIGLAPTTASAMGFSLLRFFRTKYPDIVLNIVESFAGGLEKMLLSRKLDLAILFSTRLPRDIEAIPLVDERIYLISQKRRGSRSGGRISLSKAANRSLILPTRLHGFRQLLDGAFAKQDLRPNVVAEVDSVNVLLEAVIEGVGETIQPWSAVQRVTRDVSYLEIADRDLFRPNFLCSMASDLLSPSISVARDIIRDEALRLMNQRGWTRSVSRN
jgi:LysR family tcuABC transcriptional regulator